MVKSNVRISITSLFIFLYPMKWSEQQLAYILLHIAVVLFGFTAILGVLIEMKALDIVWWRVLITAISLTVFLRGKRSLKNLSKASILTFLGIGVIVSLHWVCFYGAVKLSNASITLVCMATASFFTALIEPMVTKSKWDWKEMATGLLIIPGMFLVVGGLEGKALLGVAVGLLSAALAALFASLNKKFIDRADHYSITFLEMSGAWLFLSLVLPFFAEGESWITLPEAGDWGLLLILALLCTTFAFILTLKALKYISAFASNLVINLEPVYGILLAMVFLQEHKELTTSFYLGVIIIVGVVFGYPIWRKKFG